MSMFKEQRTGASKHERGFTLLLSALVASIVVSLGTAIFAIAQKEVTLSSIGRDSQYAFYAADTAAECALYWDARHQLFPSAAPAPNDIPLTCDGQPDSEFFAEPISGGAFRSEFRVEPNGYCVQIYVTKTPESGSIRTVIRADGYSTACDAITTSPRALQRSVELRY